METVWWFVLMAVMAVFAFSLGLRVGSNVLIETITQRAKRRMTVEEYKAFRKLIVSLLIKEEGD